MTVEVDKMAGLKLAVVPSDPLESWEKAGYISWLPGYFNPTGMFDEVFIVSPLEPVGTREAHGMTVVGAPRQRFAEAIRKIAPDVIRAYNGDWAADLLAHTRPRSLPTLASVHTIPPNPIHGSLQCMDQVICISEAVRAAVLDVGVRPDRTRQVPNRVDTSLFTPLQDEERLAELSIRFPAGRHILFVGREDRAKNLTTLIDAMPKLPPDYHLIVIGRGNEERFASQAESLGAADRCHFISRVPNSELPGWYSWCDCFCVPSIFEGFGIVFIEAAACGAAIVTSDIAPMNEYLADGDSASLVTEHKNPEALAGAIKKICEEEDYARRISEGALKVSRGFDRAQVEAREAAVYTEAISAQPPDDARWEEIQRWRRRDRMLTHLRKLAPRRVVGGIVRRTRAALGV